MEALEEIAGWFDEHSHFVLPQNAICYHDTPAQLTRRRDIDGVMLTLREKEGAYELIFSTYPDELHAHYPLTRSCDAAYAFDQAHQALKEHRVHLHIFGDRLEVSQTPRATARYSSR